MSHAIFTYGTLMFPEVMNAVCGRLYDSTPASLEGYQLTSLISRVYPAILPVPGARCEGLLYTGIDEDMLVTLDDFEGDEYERVQVDVQSAGQTTSAWAYVLTASCFTLASGQDWKTAIFREKHLKNYLSDIQS